MQRWSRAYALCSESRSCTIAWRPKRPNSRHGNRTLEQRVAEQIAQIERVSQLKRFLSPQIAELILSSSPDSALESHRRQVTIAFCDLRGFTAFAEIAELEEEMDVMREYHAA